MTLFIRNILIKFFFLLLTFFVLSTNLVGQKKELDKKLTLSVREEKLEDILDKISEKTGIYFSYNSDLISENQRFTLSAKNENIHKFLDKLLIGTSLHYKVIQKQVVIFKKIKDQLNPKEKISIFGTVRDAITEEPISGVNVFISGSLKGTSTDKFGNFSLDNLSPDLYEVVFSHVSYDISLTNVSAKHKRPTALNLVLIPKTVQLQEIEVNAERDKNWNRHYYLFESEFLGSTINAAKCRILNSEAIRFEYDKKTQVLLASTDQPLLIDNEALGYEIQYFLESFENSQTKSIIHGVLNYREKTPNSRKEQRRWKKNRKRSYYGSYAHFLRALYDNKLKKAGFKIYLVDTVDSKQAIPITANGILFEEIKGLDVKMKFDGFLKVDFTKTDYMSSNEIIREYYRTGNAILNGVQTSYIQLNMPFVTIQNNGLLKEQFAITKYGYWSWERVAEYLPFEYKP